MVTDAPALLKQAAALVNLAIEQLDLRERTCGDCGRRNFDNAAHASVYEQLKAMPEKLGAVANRLAATETANRNIIATTVAKEDHC